MTRLQLTRVSYKSLLLLLSGILLCLLIFPNSAYSQVVSPMQAGHYTPTVANIRDFAKPPSGLFVLWYNVYSTSDTYIDRDGNEFNSIDLDQIHPALPNININFDIKGFASMPALFWASDFEILGGANYIAGAMMSYVSMDGSILTERPGIIDSLVTKEAETKVSGFSDLSIVPLGLAWDFTNLDLTFLYGFYAPTGKYETGGSDNIGMGFWTHNFQGFGYYYPVPDKSTAIMLGLTYEMNSKIKDAEVTPGNCFTLEWGVSQFLSERLEVGIHGGHNWQVGDDTGDEVYWDAGVHDRKSTLAFNVSYWPWEQRLMLNGKYAFDFGVRQRFKNSYWMLNLIFVTDVLTGM